MQTTTLDTADCLTIAGAILRAMDFFELAESMTGKRSSVVKTELHADMTLKLHGLHSGLD